VKRQENARNQRADWRLEPQCPSAVRCRRNGRSTTVRWRLGSACIFASLLLVACGGNGDDNDAQPTATTRTALLPAVTELPTGTRPPHVATPAASPAATPVEIEDPPASP